MARCRRTWHLNPTVRTHRMLTDHGDPVSRRTVLPPADRTGCLRGRADRARAAARWRAARLLLRPAPQAALVCRFKDTALYRGEWKAIGVLEGFARAGWPVPAFHRFDGSVTHVP